ncbi:DUF4145 domain-containing protein [Paraburkholderia sp. GAS348]|uniref:DUF4145 domain-containing protein n=1 Tax=Paraburkholderia sp. GAS348 TaxID=3035132 RepID=UPI003D199987
MSFERELWSGEYSRNELPRFSCPRCGSGRLAQAADSLSVVEPEYSKTQAQHPDWEPDWDVERFNLKLLCDNSGCAEVVCVVGDTTISEYYDEELNSWALVSLLRPRAFFPAPPMMALPKEMPREVEAQIEKSFELYWTDFSSCANRLRVSVELLLDYFKVSRSAINVKAKSVQLDLNARINLFAKIEPEHAPTLTALRMIGNLGSHGDEVSREALLDALEIYEHALAELCGHRRARIDSLRQKLIASKGKY